MKVRVYSTYVKGGAAEYLYGPPEVFFKTPFGAICDPLALPGGEVVAFEGELIEEVRLGRITLMRVLEPVPLGVLKSARFLKREGIRDPLQLVPVYASTRPVSRKVRRCGPLEGSLRFMRARWWLFRALPMARPTLYRDLIQIIETARDRWYQRWLLNPDTTDWALAIQGANSRWLEIPDRNMAALLTVGALMAANKAPWDALGVKPDGSIAQRIKRLHTAVIGSDRELSRIALAAKKRLSLSALEIEEAWRYAQLVGLTPQERSRRAREARRKLIQQAAAEEWDKVRLFRG